MKLRYSQYHYFNILYIIKDIKKNKKITKINQGDFNYRAYLLDILELNFHT